VARRPAARGSPASTRRNRETRRALPCANDPSDIWWSRPPRFPRRRCWLVRPSTTSGNLRLYAPGGGSLAGRAHPPLSDRLAPSMDERPTDPGTALPVRGSFCGARSLGASHEGCLQRDTAGQPCGAGVRLWDGRLGHGVAHQPRARRHRQSLPSTSASLDAPVRHRVDDLRIASTAADVLSSPTRGSSISIMGARPDPA